MSATADKRSGGRPQELRAWPRLLRARISHGSRCDVPAERCVAQALCLWWAAHKTFSPPPRRAGRRRGPARPAGPRAHGGHGLRLLEGRHRRVGTPTRGGVGRRGGAVHIWFSARHPVLRPPCWTVPCSPMPAPAHSLRTLVVDLSRHHSMRRRRLATSQRRDSAAHSAERLFMAMGRGVRARGSPIWCPLQ
jgi:hypothetical protein